MLWLIFISVCWFAHISRYQPYSIDLYSAFYTIILTKNLDLSGTYVPFLCGFLRCNIAVQHWIHLPAKVRLPFLLYSFERTRSMLSLRFYPTKRKNFFFTTLGFQLGRAASRLARGFQRGTAFPFVWGVQRGCVPLWLEESKETGGFVAHDFPWKV